MRDNTGLALYVGHTDPPDHKAKMDGQSTRVKLRSKRRQQESRHVQGSIAASHTRQAIPFSFFLFFFR